MLESVFATLNTALQSAVFSLPNALTSTSSRLFWPLLFTPLLFIVCVTGIRLGWPSVQRQLGQYLNPKQFISKDSAIDLGFLLANSALKAAFVIPLFGSKLAIAMAVSLFLQQNLGDSQLAIVKTPSVLIIALFSLSFFVVEDLSRFSLHLTMHKVPLLWRLHQWHHSAHQLTPLTLHRVHPLEMALYHLRSLLVFGMLAGTFTWAFQSPAKVWALLGVDALGFIFNACAANLRHSGVFLGFGRLERWFISPAQHQIHHSSAAAHHDKNFGTCLAFWDKLLGSWVASKTAQTTPLKFGLYQKQAL